ncbi:hypothetical protein ACFS32_07015 [Novosphingobium pokkalii]|uniref:hypothetical protein n=1 Tax=Novosphingobium pokkalii TaxID=1770194 RepID=UPI003640983A
MAPALALALTACQREPAPQGSDSPTASAAATPEPTPEPSAVEPSPTPTLALPVKPTPEAPMTPADTAAALPALALPPRDDCAALPGWSAFAAKLATAVKTRDAAALAALSSPDVTLDYGGGHGPAELQKRLSAPLARRSGLTLPASCRSVAPCRAISWCCPGSSGTCRTKSIPA